MFIPHQLSGKTHVRTVDSAGSILTTPVRDVARELGADALMRLSERDFDEFEKMESRTTFVNFNLGGTSNEVGKIYAVVPILRPGYSDLDGVEVLPIIDRCRHHNGVCDLVLQHVSIDTVSPEHYSVSLPSIRSSEQLRRAMVTRYARLFPSRSLEELFARGCAITRLRLF